MPHIVVWNLLESEIRDNYKLGNIEKAITKAVLSIPELELKENDMSYSFPLDPSVELECPVVIIVELLFEKPKRTYEIRRLLAKRIAETFQDVVVWRIIEKIEVAVKRFDPDKDGFACSPD